MGFLFCGTHCTVLYNATQRRVKGNDKHLNIKNLVRERNTQHNISNFLKSSLHSDVPKKYINFLFFKNLLLISRVAMTAKETLDMEITYEILMNL